MNAKFTESHVEEAALSWLGPAIFGREDDDFTLASLWVVLYVGYATWRFAWPARRPSGGSIAAPDPD